MQKVSLLSTLIACTVMLTACQPSGDVADTQDYFTSSVQVTQSVFDFLVDKDADGIKALLCERLKNLPDVDAQLQDLLDGIGGNILPMDMEGARSVDTSSAAREDGVYTKMYTIGRIKGLTTDTGNTFQQLYVFYCFVDNSNPDLEGIYSIALAESDSVTYNVRLPKEEPEEEDYGTVYTPDGPRPATKEEQEAMLDEGATE